MKKADGLKQISDSMRLMDEKLDAISKDLNNPKTGLIRVNERLDAISEDLNNPRTGLRRVNERLDSISNELNNPKSGLGRLNERMDVLWEQVEKITLDTGEISETVGSHSVVLKRIESKLDRISDNTRRLDKRVKTTEAALGISPPAELALYE